MSRLKCEGDVQVWLESEACSLLLAMPSQLPRSLQEEQERLY